MFKKIGVWVVGALLCGGVSSAQEFVEFRDGRFIRAASHRLGSATMRIELGAGSWIEIPRDVVDAVEYKGRLVYQRATPAVDDVLLASADEPEGSIAPLVEGVLEARRSLPDPASFRPSPFVALRRVQQPSP